jgi:hypothetical protein
MADHYTIRGGIDSSAVFKEEVTYKTDPGTWTTGAQHFGLTQNCNPTFNRALIKLRGLDCSLPATNLVATSRDAQKILAGKSALTMSVEYQPQDFSFLKYVVGSVSGTTTKQYPQATASTLADKKKYIKLPSFTVMQKFMFGGTGDAADTALKFTGLKVGSWDVGASIGEPVKCNTSLTGADVLYDQTDVNTNYPCLPLSAEDVYHFVDSDIKVGAVSIPNLIDSFTLTIENTLISLGDIRSYVNEAIVATERDWQLKISMNLENITYIKNLLGGTGAGTDTPVKIDTITLTLTKGLTKNLKCTLFNLKQSDAFPQMAYGEVTKNNITLEAEYGYFIEDEV